MPTNAVDEVARDLVGYDAHGGRVSNHAQAAEKASADPRATLDKRQRLRVVHNGIQSLPPDEPLSTPAKRSLADYLRRLSPRAKRLRRENDVSVKLAKSDDRFVKANRPRLVKAAMTRMLGSSKRRLLDWLKGMRGTGTVSDEPASRATLGGRGPATTITHRLMLVRRKADVLDRFRGASVKNAFSPQGRFETDAAYATRLGNGIAAAKGTLRDLRIIAHAQRDAADTAFNAGELAAHAHTAVRTEIDDAIAKLRTLESVVFAMEDKLASLPAAAGINPAVHGADAAVSALPAGPMAQAEVDEAQGAFDDAGAFELQIDEAVDPLDPQPADIEKPALPIQEAADPLAPSEPPAGQVDAAPKTLYERPAAAPDNAAGFAHAAQAADPSELAEKILDGRADPTASTDPSVVAEAVEMTAQALDAVFASPLPCLTDMVTDAAVEQAVSGDANADELLAGRLKEALAAHDEVDALEAKDADQAPGDTARMKADQLDREVAKIDAALGPRKQHLARLNAAAKDRPELRKVALSLKTEVAQLEDCRAVVAGKRDALREAADLLNQGDLTALGALAGAAGRNGLDNELRAWSLGQEALSLDILEERLSSSHVLGLDPGAEQTWFAADFSELKETAALLSLRRKADDIDSRLDEIDAKIVDLRRQAAVKRGNAADLPAGSAFADVLNTKAQAAEDLARRLEDLRPTIQDERDALAHIALRQGRALDTLPAATRLETDLSEAWRKLDAAIGDRLQRGLFVDGNGAHFQGSRRVRRRAASQLNAARDRMRDLVDGYGKPDVIAKDRNGLTMRLPKAALSRTSQDMRNLFADRATRSQKRAFKAQGGKPGHAAKQTRVSLDLLKRASDTAKNMLALAAAYRKSRMVSAAASFAAPVPPARKADHEDPASASKPGQIADTVKINLGLQKNQAKAAANALEVAAFTEEEELEHAAPEHAEDKVKAGAAEHEEEHGPSERLERLHHAEVGMASTEHALGVAAAAAGAVKHWQRRKAMKTKQLEGQELAQDFKAELDAVRDTKTRADVFYRNVIRMHAATQMTDQAIVHADADIALHTGSSLRHGYQTAAGVGMTAAHAPAALIAQVALPASSVAAIIALSDTGMAIVEAKEAYSKADELEEIAARHRTLFRDLCRDMGLKSLPSASRRIDVEEYSSVIHQSPLKPVEKYALTRELVRLQQSEMISDLAKDATKRDEQTLRALGKAMSFLGYGATTVAGVGIVFGAGATAPLWVPVAAGLGAVAGAVGAAGFGYVKAKRNAIAFSSERATDAVLGVADPKVLADIHEAAARKGITPDQEALYRVSRQDRTDLAHRCLAELRFQCADHLPSAEEESRRAELYAAAEATRNERDLLANYVGTMSPEALRKFPARAAMLRDAERKYNAAEAALTSFNESLYVKLLSSEAPILDTLHDTLRLHPAVILAMAEADPASEAYAVEMIKDRIED
ncbi:MAG: hypothetical protein AAF968_04440 [Pseudomonadota bacterium]